MQAIDIRANSAGMAVASAYAVGALFDTLVGSGVLTREQAGAALHDALSALGRRTETPEQRSCPEKAFRPFKRPENSGLRPSANQIAVSNTDTCCLALKNKENRC
jgi:hypothetical protein